MAKPRERSPKECDAPIEWATQPAEMFNRLVKASGTRWCPSDDADVRMINGRGGDQGGTSRSLTILRRIRREAPFLHRVTLDNETQPPYPHDRATT